MPARPPPCPAEVEDSSESSTGDFLSSLLQQSYRVEPPGRGEMRHGTEGWKCLETSFRVRRALRSLCCAQLAGLEFGAPPAAQQCMQQTCPGQESGGVAEQRGPGPPSP